MKHRENFIFIYKKEHQTKVLNLQRSKDDHANLIKEGWKHTSTLDCIVFLNFILNIDDENELFNEIKNLTE
jgi:hypothetical protein